MTNWQKGDLALCVADGVNTSKGELFHVTHVSAPKSFAAWGSTPAGIYVPLVFAERRHPINTNGWYSSARFRKVTPPKADQFDREVIDLMAGKKVPA